MRRASLKTIAGKMKGIDICTMITRDGRNSIHARPMSNNGKVEYDGDSWFFTYDYSNKVKHIKADKKVSLIYHGKDMLFIECYGIAAIIKDKKVIEEKWMEELDRWFPKGIDTPGICMIRVNARRVHYWHKEEEGEYKS